MSAVLPLPPTRLPALEPLLNGPLWNEWQEQGRVFPLADVRAAVRYVRLKPETSCRLAVFAATNGSTAVPPPGFLLYLFPDEERACTAYRKARQRPWQVPNRDWVPFVHRRLAVVGVPYPNDREIAGLKHLYRRNGLARALARMHGVRPPAYGGPETPARLDLLAYKPGRRAVFRAEAEVAGRPVVVHLKVDSDASGGGKHAKLVRIHAAVPDGATWGVPAPVGTVKRRHVRAARWIAGQPLCALEPRGLEQALPRVARALVELHASDVSFGDLQDVADRASFDALAHDMGRLLPAEAESIRRLGERLARRASFLNEPAATIHGDFDPSQVLLERERPVLVDLDRAGRGHPLVDIGNLLAHLEPAPAPGSLGRSFVAAYEETSGRRLDPGSLRVATAAAAFRLSVFPFRSLAPDWPDRMRGRLALVERLLDGA